MLRSREVIQLAVENLTPEERIVIDGLFYERITGMDCLRRLAEEFPDKEWTYKAYLVVRDRAYRKLRKVLDG